MLRKAHKAIWVTLYRPYIWEAKNIVMLLSAIENLLLFLLTLYIFIKSGIRNAIRHLTTSPVIIFCLIFSIVFSFAVGISTYNFGSLVRYKIPMIPFFVSGLFILYNYSMRSKKAGRFVRVEYWSITFFLPAIPIAVRSCWSPINFLIWSTQSCLL